MEKVQLVSELLSFAHTLVEIEIDRCVPATFFVSQPGSGVVSPAGIYTHTVVDEDHGISGALGEPLLYESGGWRDQLGFEPRGDITTEWAAGLHYDLDAMRAYAAAVYERSASYFAGLAAGDADRMVTNWEVIREQGTVRYAQRQMPFLFNFMDNVVLHTTGHAGEIAIVTNLAR